MALAHVLLIALALGLLAVLARALAQNRALLRQVRAGTRPVGGLLRDALLVWSPLALAILVATLTARRVADASIEVAYRMPVIDAWCRVEGVAGNPVIPCTGMDGTLARDAMRRAGAVADVDALLSARYREARRRLVALTADDVRAAATDRAQFVQSFAPRSLLGLPRAPEDDPQLQRLRADLKQMLDNPVPPARDPVDMLRFMTARNARIARLREVTAAARARRITVNDEAYASLPREEQGRRWLAHRVSHWLAAVPVQPDAATNAALARLLARDGDDAANLQRVQRGFASLLARNESVAAGIVHAEAQSPRGAATLALALSPPPSCTVAAPGAEVRVLPDGRAVTVGDTNTGTFPCFAFADNVASLRLAPLDFRESVRLSIDRWHAQELAASVRRLGILARAATSSRSAAEQVASAIPRGIDLGRAPCGLLHPLGCGGNLVRQAMEEQLAASFADVAEPVGRGATSVATAADDLDARVGAAMVTLDARLERMRGAAHAQADRLFLLGDLLRLLGWLTLALVVVKSFLYVLALEVFHHEDGLTFGLPATSTVEGTVRAARQLTIDRDFPHALITRQQLSNTDNDLRLAPWPWSAPLARILRGRYFVFTRGTFLADAERPARGMVASASGGMSIVEWRMRAGEEVVFAYRDFFGASENVRLRSELSLRLSTLLLGRLFFRSARCEDGEGLLLLRAHVEEIDPQHIRAIPPERLLAWHRHARFAIHSARTPWKTLLNGYTLVRKPGVDGAEGQVLVSSEDVGANLGSIRFVKRIFSALF